MKIRARNHHHKQVESENRLSKEKAGLGPYTSAEVK